MTSRRLNQVLRPWVERQDDSDEGARRVAMDLQVLRRQVPVTSHEKQRLQRRVMASLTDSSGLRPRLVRIFAIATLVLLATSGIVAAGLWRYPDALGSNRFRRTPTSPAPAARPSVTLRVRGTPPRPVTSAEPTVAGQPETTGTYPEIVPAPAMPWEPSPPVPPAALVARASVSRAQGSPQAPRTTLKSAAGENFMHSLRNVSSSGAPFTEGVRESALVADAISHLRTRDDPTRALETLDRYLTEFPGGLLVPEVGRIRIEALIQAGRIRDARTILSALSDQTLNDVPDLRILRGELNAADDHCTAALPDFEIGINSGRQDLRERSLYGRIVCRARDGDEAGSRSDAHRYLSEFSAGPHRDEIARALSDRP